MVGVVALVGMQGVTIVHFAPMSTFTRQIKIVDGILESIVISICGATRYRVGREKSSQGRNVTPHSHLNPPRRQFSPPLLAAEPSETTRFARFRVAELIEFKFGSRF